MVLDWTHPQKTGHKHHWTIPEIGSLGNAAEEKGDPPGKEMFRLHYVGVGSTVENHERTANSRVKVEDICQWPMFPRGAMG